ncbi:MAG: hypothetical protein ACRDJN_08955 [Chloroflexota bacterium]
MADRRALLFCLTTAGAVALVACGGGQTAAAPEPTAGVTPSPQPFQIQVQMRPQEARLGQDEKVEVRARFMRITGGRLRPVSGAKLSAVVNYPSGPQTFTSEVTTFPDGVTTLVVPVAPATRGANVRVEVIMKYQGQEYRQASGFTVR